MSQGDRGGTRNAFDLRRHARLRSDAPHVRGVEPGRWYDIYSGDPTTAATDVPVLVRPADALPGDRESYIPLALSMVELRDPHGRRLVRDAAGEWWTASRCAPDRLLFVAAGGAYRMVKAAAQRPDDESDDTLRAWLDSGAPAFPSGLRVEAQVKAAQAWSYRMLNAEAWYLVDQERTTDSAVTIMTMGGPRIVDAAHVEVRSFLD